MGDRVIASAHLAGGLVAGMTSARFVEHTTRRIVTAFILGVVTHVALDAIPHADYGSFPGTTVRLFVLLESVMVGLAASFLLRDRLPSSWLAVFAAGVAGAALPDIKFLAWIVLPSDAAMVVSRYGTAFHDRFHFPSTIPLSIRAAFQIAAALVSLAALALFPRTAGAGRS